MKTGNSIGIELEQRIARLDYIIEASSDTRVWDTFFGIESDPDDRICQAAYSLAQLGNTILSMYPTLSVTEIELFLKLQS